MKKSLAFMLVVACLMAGCSFNVEVLTPMPSQTAPTENVQVVDVVPASTTAALPTVPMIGFTPTTSNPVFFGAYMSLRKNDVSGIVVFPTGANEIFAHWSYQNMRDGLTVKREWYLDDQPWLTREEPWDYQKYGASGWISDISIYDYNTGLPSGKYKLVVSINDVAQPIGMPVPEGGAQAYVEFEVLPSVEAVSPNGEWRAVSLLDHIVLFDKNANSSDLVTGREIVSLLWLDDRHLLFVDRDRSGQVPNLLIGVRDTLRLVDITTREAWSLYESDRTIGRTGELYPSPNGKYIASIIGTGFGDACFIDSKLGFMEISSDFRSAEVFLQEQFTDFPVLINQSLYPPSIGSWTSATQYTVPLNEICGTDGSLTGIYVFDVSNRSVTYQLTGDKP